MDWTASMIQKFEFYEVDPYTWTDKRKLDFIISGEITRDFTTDTMVSGTITTSEDLSEIYIRMYLVGIQNGIEERFPLVTLLFQTPGIDFDGKNKSISMDGYSPLVELVEKKPPIGYFVESGTKILDVAYRIGRDNLRAPVTPGGRVVGSIDIDDPSNSEIPYNFVAETDEDWLSFIKDLLTYARYYISVDPYGNVSFEPEQDFNALQPVWTFNDGNSSILLPSISLSRDLYNIPNVVEVIFSNDTTIIFSRVLNDDPNSPISTVSRGREIVERVTDPEFSVDSPSQEEVDSYAERYLRDRSALEYTITYSHGYCPVNIGDCVRLDYERFGLTGVKARVIRQKIQCVTGCTVEETAVYTNNLWR